MVSSVQSSSVLCGRPGGVTPKWPPLWHPFVCLLPRLRENIILNFKFKNEATRGNLRKTKDHYNDDHFGIRCVWSVHWTGSSSKSSPGSSPLFKIKNRHFKNRPGEYPGDEAGSISGQE